MSKTVSTMSGHGIILWKGSEAHEAPVVKRMKIQGYANPEITRRSR
jgi:hypothetical protein